MDFSSHETTMKIKGGGILFVVELSLGWFTILEKSTFS